MVDEGRRTVVDGENECGVTEVTNRNHGRITDGGLLGFPIQFHDGVVVFQRRFDNADSGSGGVCKMVCRLIWERVRMASLSRACWRASGQVRSGLAAGGDNGGGEGREGTKGSAGRTYWNRRQEASAPRSKVEGRRSNGQAQGAQGERVGEGESVGDALCRRGVQGVWGK